MMAVHPHKDVHHAYSIVICDEFWLSEGEKERTEYNRNKNEVSDVALNHYCMSTISSFGSIFL